MRYSIQTVNAVVVMTSAFFIQSSLADELPLPPSDSQFETEHFSGSGNCAVCHNDLTDEAGNDVSIEKEWKTSMMANSARDPLWQAKVASELKRNPHLDHEINNACTRCHMPMANVESTIDGGDMEIYEHGLIDTAHPDYDAAMDGVSCTLCHQIEDTASLRTEARASGGYSINPDERVAYGPKESPTEDQMLAMTGFTPTHGAHMSESEVCGTCHDLKTPYVDGEGNVVELDGPHGGFPEQMVYTEWENSAYAVGRKLEKSCQDCHMPQTDGVKLASRPGWLTPEDDFSRHTFAGVNSVMMKIIDDNSEELGATDADFTDAIESARENLAGAAELKAWSPRIDKGRLKVSMAIRNLTGHKLPSGYPSRRVYLHFVVKNDAGDIIFESGRTNDDGSIVGVDSDRDQGTFEPHHEYIWSPEQVQVYEPIMGDTDGQPTYTLLEAAQYLKDNRLLPAGFNKAKVPEEVAVHGLARDDKNFNYAWDTVKYTVKLPKNDSSAFYTVEASLNYQPVSYGYLQDLFLDTDEPAVARFKRMWESTTLRKETIASTSFTVTR